VSIGDAPMLILLIAERVNGPPSFTKYSYISAFTYAGTDIRTKALMLQYWMQLKKRKVTLENWTQSQKAAKSECPMDFGCTPCSVVRLLWSPLSQY